ncbi:MAG: helix-turn-helix domain-containing protein [Paludibacter sp.]|nr:helix-turn-helix domain-containing protein [Paludibacter sp.]
MSDVIAAKKERLQELLNSYTLADNIIEEVTIATGNQILENLEHTAQVHSIPRQIAMYRIRRETSLSLCDIASIFKKSGHQPVVYGIDRIDGLLKFNREFREKYGRIVG